MLSAVINGFFTSESAPPSPDFLVDPVVEREQRQERNDPGDEKPSHVLVVEDVILV